MHGTAATRRTAVCLAFCLFLGPLAFSQQVIDRIVARIESDVILASDIRLLSRYQLLVEGKAESDAEILDLAYFAARQP